MFGICLICSAGCNSCSGIYINTSPDSLTRRCESCSIGKYFALEGEFDYGYCSPCQSQTPNCLRCNAAGFCI